MHPMKKIYTKFDKKEIEGMPLVTFQGRIITVSTVKEAKKAVEYLLDAELLGIDTETRPTFKKGQSYKVSMLQVSTIDTCFLFRLNILGITDDIKRLLEDTTVPKIGLSLKDDILALHGRRQFKPGLYYDLQKHVREIGIEDLSLQKLYANIFGQKISKRQQLSNWNAENLDEKQKVYAATDAWACIMLYNELQRLIETGDFELIVVQDEPESDQNQVEN